MKLLWIMLALGLAFPGPAAGAAPASRSASETPGAVITVPWFGVESYTVSNTTIISPWSGTIMTVRGNNNRILAGNAGGHGHGRYAIIGNNNFLSTGPSGGNIDIVGTNNTIRADNAFVTEHNGGNHYVTVGRGGIWVWQDSVGGVQGQPFTNTVDLTSPLNQVGCRHASGCDPASVLTYSGSGRRGLHAVDTRKADGQAPAMRSHGPIFYFFDCSGNNLTLADFLAHSAVLGGPAPDSWPARPRATAGPGWGTTTPDDIRIGAFGPMNFTYGASSTNFMFMPGGPWIFDAWAYANKATVTATVCVVSGRINSAKCTRPMVGTQQSVNERLTALKYMPPKGSATDTFTMKVTNSGGGAAAMTLPMTISHGGVCP